MIIKKLNQTAGQTDVPEQAEQQAEPIEMASLGQAELQRMLDKAIPKEKLVELALLEYPNAASNSVSTVAGLEEDQRNGDREGGLAFLSGLGLLALGLGVSGGGSGSRTVGANPGGGTPVDPNESLPPTGTPTAAPTSAPTAEPTAVPTSVPTLAPTAAPTAAPTSLPTAAPTGAPTAPPTPAPTASPTASPTPTPTPAPSDGPLPIPSLIGFPSVPGGGDVSSPLTALMAGLVSTVSRIVQGQEGGGESRSSEVSIADINSTVLRPLGLNLIDISGLQVGGVDLNTQNPQDAEFTVLDPALNVYAGGTQPIVSIEDINLINSASLSSVQRDLSTTDPGSFTAPDSSGSGPNGLVLRNLSIDFGTIAEVRNLSVDLSRASLSNSTTGLGSSASKTFSEDGLSVEPGITLEGIRLLGGKPANEAFAGVATPLDMQLTDLAEQSQVPALAGLPATIAAGRDGFLSQIPGMSTNIFTGNPAESNPNGIRLLAIEIPQFSPLTNPIGRSVEGVFNVVGNGIDEGLGGGGNTLSVFRPLEDLDTFIAGTVVTLVSAAFTEIGYGMKFIATTNRYSTDSFFNVISNPTEENMTAAVFGVLGEISEAPDGDNAATRNANNVGGIFGNLSGIDAPGYVPSAPEGTTPTDPTPEQQFADDMQTAFADMNPEAAAAAIENFASQVMDDTIGVAAQVAGGGATSVAQEVVGDFADTGVNTEFGTFFNGPAADEFGAADAFQNQSFVDGDSDLLSIVDGVLSLPSEGAMALGGQGGGDGGAGPSLVNGLAPLDTALATNFVEAGTRALTGAGDGLELFADSYDAGKSAMFESLAAQSPTAAQAFFTGLSTSLPEDVPAVLMGEQPTDNAAFAQAALTSAPDVAAAALAAGGAPSAPTGGDGPEFEAFVTGTPTAIESSATTGTPDPLFTHLGTLAA